LPFHRIVSTLQNEYTNLGIPVEHYTQTLAQLIDSGKLTLSKPVDLKVTYQDPAFSGSRTRFSTNPGKFSRPSRVEVRRDGQVAGQESLL